MFKGSGIFFFLLLPSRSPDYTRAPTALFAYIFRPPATKTTSQLKFSHFGGANKSWSTLFYVAKPRSMKRSDSFRSFLRILTLKTRWEAKRWNFTKKTRKMNFLILEPLCEKREKWFFSFFFLFPWFKGVLKHGLGQLHWDFWLPNLRKEAFDFAPVDLPTTGVP